MLNPCSIHNQWTIILIGFALDFTQIEMSPRKWHHISIGLITFSSLFGLGLNCCMDWARVEPGLSMDWSHIDHLYLPENDSIYGDKVIHVMVINSMYYTKAVNKFDLLVTDVRWILFVRVIMSETLQWISLAMQTKAIKKWFLKRMCSVCDFILEHTKRVLSDKAGICPSIPIE